MIARDMADIALVLRFILTNPKRPLYHPELTSPPSEPVALLMSGREVPRPSVRAYSTPPYCHGACMGALGAGDTAAPLQPTRTDPQPPHYHPALPSPRGSVAAARGGPSDQPRAAAPALPPTVSSAFSTSFA